MADAKREQLKVQEQKAILVAVLETGSRIDTKQNNEIRAQSDSLAAI